jgi:DNA polymerase-3 subunit beta
MSVVAVDGYRISLRNAVVEDISENIKVVVPANALTEVARLSPGSDDYMIPVCFSDRFIRFELETCIVVSNVLNGEYINYKKSLSAESEATTKIVVDRNELLHSLDCACLVAVESGKRIPVKFVISSGALSITSNTEKGTVSDEIAITCEGKDLTIAFNPRYLIDALKAIEDSTVSFHFTSPTSPCVIRPVEDGNYKYLILPLRQSK